MLISALDGADARMRSSSSQSGLMVRMLEALHIADVHRVLETGAGTDYNAALMAHWLGDRNVFSIDVEPGLLDLARARLAELGYAPVLVAGDGALGLPEQLNAPAVLAVAIGGALALLSQAVLSCPPQPTRAANPRSGDNDVSGSPAGAPQKCREPFAQSVQEEL